MRKQSKEKISGHGDISVSTEELLTVEISLVCWSGCGFINTSCDREIVGRFLAASRVLVRE